jgi:agmatinase
LNDVFILSAMSIPSALALLVPSLAFAHSTHHVESQEPFSEARLEELEKKWGIDVKTS